MRRWWPDTGLCGRDGVPRRVQADDRHGACAAVQLTPRFRVLTPAARRVLAVIEREIGAGDHDHVRINLTGFHRRGARRGCLEAA